MNLKKPLKPSINPSLDKIIWLVEKSKQSFFYFWKPGSVMVLTFALHSHVMQDPGGVSLGGIYAKNPNHVKSSKGWVTTVCRVKSWCNFLPILQRASKFQTEEQRGLKGHAQWPIFMNRSNRCGGDRRHMLYRRPWKNIRQNPILTSWKADVSVPFDEILGNPDLFLISAYV